MRDGCSTMSQTIQSTGRFGRYARPSARRWVTSGSSSTSPFNGPLSTAVTRRPRCASCHVQPPGAAPRSTARMPARSTSGSRSPRNVTNASASFSVERDGAPPGIRSRGIPIVQGLAHGATLAPTISVRAVGKQHVEIGAGRAGNVGGGARRLRVPATRWRGAPRAPASAPTTPCRHWCPVFRAGARNRRRVRARGTGDPGKEIRRGSVRSRRRAARRDRDGRALSRGRTADAARCRRRATGRRSAARARMRAARAEDRSGRGCRRRSRGPPAHRHRSPRGRCPPNGTDRRRLRARSRRGSARRPGTPTGLDRARSTGGGSPGPRAARTQTFSGSVALRFISSAGTGRPWPKPRRFGSPGGQA